MQRIDPKSRLHVVVGVVQNKHGCYLIQQRPKGKVCEGRWEFPGGKVEPDESSREALIRELQEELSITPTSYQPLMNMDHDYDHAYVHLEVFLVNQITGEVTANENQKFKWESKNAIKTLPVLEAVYPILRKLS